jgi:hypothetical protein
MELDKAERGVPILLKATILRVREGKIEAQTTDGQLVYCRPESVIVDKGQAKANSATTKKVANDPPPSPGFAESPLA